jgi:hypothetical protein
MGFDNEDKNFFAVFILIVVGVIGFFTLVGLAVTYPLLWIIPGVVLVTLVVWAIRQLLFVGRRSGSWR